MKRIFTVFFAVLSIALVFSFVLPTSTASGNTCGENAFWEFDESNGTLAISGSGKIDIGNYSPWYDLRKKISTLIIDEGIIEIGDRAFSGLSNVISVSLPSSLNSIGYYSFDGCRSIKTISLPNLSYIGNYAFNGCSSLTEVIIPTGVTKINYGTFSGCSQLKHVGFHNNLTEIDSYAFSSCVSLTSLVVPDSVKTIGSSAFHGCHNLSSISLSRNLTSLGSNAFQACTHLSKIVIPDNLTKIATYTFANCTSLQEVYIGAGTSEIVHTAFDGCSNLAAFAVSKESPYFYVDNGVLYTKSKSHMLMMPDGFSGSYSVLSGTKELSDYVCHGVVGLSSITVPGSVTTIGKYAFANCTELKNVKLSSGLTIIEPSSFVRTNISEISIPKTVTKIGNSAFSGCQKLDRVNFTGDAPQIEHSIFSGIQPYVYYPGEKRGWDSAIGLYGGIPTWVNTNCKKHIPVTDYATDPTCTESGLTEGSHCSECLTTIVEQKIIPASGHQYDQWTTIDQKTHSTICSVCSQEITASHQWDNGNIVKEANCISNGEIIYTCTDCNTVRSEIIDLTNTHNYDAGSVVDDNTHKLFCPDCGIEETGDHIWDDGIIIEEATCIEKGLISRNCIYCNAEKTESISVLDTHTFDNSCDDTCNICTTTRTITHSYNDAYSNNKDGHWIQCAICCIEKDFSQHVPGNPPTADEPQICTICNYMLLPSLGHIHSLSQDWFSNEQAHWHICTECPELSSYQAHSFDNDCDNFCNTCSYSREVSHNYRDEWEYDEQNHWRSCAVCGTQKDITKHSINTAITGTTTNPCQICGLELAPESESAVDLLEHTPPRIGTIIGIVLLIIAIPGAACTTLIMLRKRTTD